MLYINLVKVRQFVRHLTWLYFEKQKLLPEWIDEGLLKIEDYFLELKSEGPNIERMRRLHLYRKELRNLKILDVYGFNSARFDLPVLAGPLLTILKESGPVNVLKKMNSYITISNAKFSFKDVLRFHSPCSYEKFVSLWSTPGAKSVWPYAHFSTVEEINQCKKFPKRSEFASELHNKKLPDIQSYIIAKTEFHRRKLLPKGHKDRIISMRGFLKYYNIQDVQPLASAIMNCFNSYRNFFDVNPHAELSLPSLAQKAMIENFKKDSPFVYSFNEKNRKIGEIFRDRVYGGLTNVYHRHVRTFESEDHIPDRAKYSESGDRFSSILRTVLNLGYF